MQVAVWDTYVIKEDGNVMHFDIISSADVRDEDTIHSYGKKYLQTKDQQNQSLSSKECSFCHIEQATDEMIVAIQDNGYFIIEMQGCE